MLSVLKMGMTSFKIPFLSFRRKFLPNKKFDSSISRASMSAVSSL